MYLYPRRVGGKYLGFKSTLGIIGKTRPSILEATLANQSILHQIQQILLTFFISAIVYV